MEKIFNIKYIDLNLQTSEKDETIEHLAHLIEERLLDVGKYIEDVKEREAITTTGIGDGIAIPHAKSPWVKETTVVVGKSLTGIRWESLDNNPVNLVFLIAVPENGGDTHLKILQKLVINLMDDEFKSRLLQTMDEKVIEKLLNKK